MEIDGATVDLKLKGKRTFAVADALAARHVPFVFVTALIHHDAPARYANVPWLEKPFSPQAVCRALEDEMCHSQESTGRASTSPPNRSANACAASGLAKQNTTKSSSPRRR
jgi:hypothetical protein